MARGIVRFSRPSARSTLCESQPKALCPVSAVASGFWLKHVRVSNFHFQTTSAITFRPLWSLHPACPAAQCLSPAPANVTPCLLCEQFKYQLAEMENLRTRTTREVDNAKKFALQVSLEAVWFTFLFVVFQPWSHNPDHTTLVTQPWSQPWSTTCCHLMSFI